MAKGQLSLCFLSGEQSVSQKPYSGDTYLLCHLPELDHMAILPSGEAVELSIFPGYIITGRDGASGRKGEKNGYWINDYQCLPHEVYHPFT